MKQSLEYILNNYRTAYHEEFNNHPVGSFIRRNAVSTIIQKSIIDTNNYTLKGSSGQGKWAEVPWIAVFDREITATATKGFDIVYLFCADMSGVYISLNQGWTYYENKYGTKEGRVNIKKVSTVLRQGLHSSLNDFTIDEIDLKSVNKRLAEGYELGHICGKFYQFDNIPNDTVLINDLRNLMGVYRELKALLGNRSVEQFNDLIISDQELFENPEDKDEANFQKNVLSTAPAVTPPSPQPKPPLFLQGKTKRYHRNPSIAKEALVKANFRCENDINHTTFLSNTTGENFVEAHHLIPMKLQETFNFSLDVPGNIVSLCPNCHRAIHLSVEEIKKEMLSKLYSKRISELHLFGIGGISLDDLILSY